MCGSERGRIVEAVADHQHLAPAPSSALDAGDLVAPAARRRPAADARLVAAASRPRLRRSPDSSSVAKPAAAGARRRRRHRAAAGPRSASRRGAVRRRDTTRRRSPSGASAPHHVAEPSRSTPSGPARSSPNPATSRTSVGRDRRPARPRPRDHGARIGMPARGREAGRAREHGISRRSASCASAGSPSVSVPVLSNTTVSTSASRSRPSAALTSTPLPNSRPSRPPARRARPAPARRDT